MRLGLLEVPDALCAQRDYRKQVGRAEKKRDYDGPLVVPDAFGARIRPYADSEGKNEQSKSRKGRIEQQPVPSGVVIPQVDCGGFGRRYHKQHKRANTHER